VNGTVMVEQFTGVQISTEELGSAANLARYAGVPAAWSPTARRVAAVEDLLAYLPDHVDTEPDRWPDDDPPDRAAPRPAS
jgi:acetyl-CoA carboxylase carboxyltransferase component